MKAAVTATATVAWATISLPSGPAGAAPVCADGDGLTTCTFAYSGAPETWIVPDSILAARVALRGAGGGSFMGGGSLSNPGGAGGFAAAEIAAVPGTAWELRVGGGGGAVGACVDLELPPAGGFNGGADGGQFHSGPQVCESASGGGATDLRIGGADLADRVLVAGGGGAGTNTGIGAYGGVGGGATGGSGLTAFGAIGGVSVGGAGGDATGTTGSLEPGLGSTGELGVVGGRGGSGGGGWWGGAGGAGAAGGGGGSGFGPPGAVLTAGMGAPPDQPGDAVIIHPVPAIATSVTPTLDGAIVEVAAEPGSHVADVHVAAGPTADDLTFTSTSASVGPGSASTTLTLAGLPSGQPFALRVVTTIDGFGTARSAPLAFATPAGPVADDMHLTTAEDQAITAPVAATGTDLSFNTVAGPAHGIVDYHGGDLTYTPDPDFSGTDTFTYRATSTAAASDDGVVTVEVGPVDDPVEARPDIFTTGSGQPVGGNVLANDIAHDGPMTATLADPPTAGTVTLAPDGTFTYTPSAGFSGTDVFTYRAVDGSPAGGAATPVALTGDVATVTIIVAAAPPTPVVPPTLPATGGSPNGLLLAATLVLLAGAGLTLVGIAARRRS